MEYVIIGNSVAAVAAIEAIREKDRDGKITIVSEEKHHNYSSPLISYFLAGTVLKDQLSFRPKNFYADNGVNLLLGVKAVNLEAASGRVILSSGSAIPFDRLLISAGGMPIKPSLKDMELEGVFTFTRLEDALAIKKYISRREVKKALILGGGLIGLKASEALMALKIKVTLVELAPRILSTTFDQKASILIEGVFKENGGEIITNNSLVELLGEKGCFSQAVLKDFRRISADLLIVAIGVRPNLELIKDTGITTNKGILVNENMETNIPGIFAAGDVAEVKDMLTREPRLMAIWTEAFRQGRLAGYNMAGIKKEYGGSLAMNSVEIGGVATISVGETDPQDEKAEILSRIEPEKKLYKKLVLRDNVLTGVILVNDIERAGIYTGLIRDKVNVSSFKSHLLREDFGVISLPKEYHKHLISGQEVLM